MPTHTLSPIKQPPFFLCLAILLTLVVGAEQGITYVIGDLTLAPLLSIIAMGLLAVFFTWKQVLFASPFFVVTSYYLILGTAKFPVIRAMSVFFAGALAAWAARQRQQIENHSKEVEQVLQALSVPWILSDSVGNITRVSDQAASLVSLPVHTIVGTSFFSFFSPLSGKGEFIRRYLDAFEAKALPGKMSLTVSGASTQNLRVTASFSIMEIEDGQRLLTVLDLSKNKPNP